MSWGRFRKSLIRRARRARKLLSPDQSSRGFLLETLESRRLLTAAELQVIDNGDPGFSTQGNWTLRGEASYQNDIAFSAPGSGSDRATWSFTVTPGRYRVSANWSSHTNRATDATYSN